MKRPLRVETEMLVCDSCIVQLEREEKEYEEADKHARKLEEQARKARCRLTSICLCHYHKTR